MTRKELSQVFCMAVRCKIRATTTLCYICTHRLLYTVIRKTHNFANFPLFTALITFLKMLFLENSLHFYCGNVSMFIMEERKHIRKKSICYCLEFIQCGIRKFFFFFVIVDLIIISRLICKKRRDVSS